MSTLANSMSGQAAPASMASPGKRSASASSSTAGATYGSTGSGSGTENLIWLIKTVDGMIPDPASPDGPKIEEPWTTWGVHNRRNPNSAIKVPVLGPDIADLALIVMDVMDEDFDKYED